jgi:2,4-dienoyl-CoA reductase-like NADH-dependent reductase (Old Yellow Enzyme family)/thioredoxin reductase
VDTFGHLFSPFTIGGVELRNRIVMLPMTTGYAESDQSTGDRLIDYYAARARGGAGLIIAPVSPSPAGSPVDAGLYHDRFIPGARRMTETVHGLGAKVSALLISTYHLILNADTDGVGGMPEVVGPSPVVNALLRVAARELTVEEIGFIVAQYGRAAARAKAAGFDLVEIMAGGGYLVNRFLSPLNNTRTDKYGGSLEKRTRFLTEIIESARSAAGEDFPVTVRLNLQENIEGGYGIAEAVEIAKILEKTGISGFTTYIGRHESPIPTVQASVPKGGFVYLTEQLKSAVRLPVTAANRINDPFVAERIVAEGKADLVGMGRALIADPGLPNKAREGKTDEIVPCLACSNCLSSMLTTYRQWGQPASATCFVNPEVGKEGESSLEPAATPKKIVVIGAGPAGLQTARVAALRGHDVTLYDSADRAGGRLLIGTIPPFKQAIGVLAESLATRAVRAGIKLNLRVRADRRLVEKERPDALVVAVGGKPCSPDIPGSGGENVVLAEDVLTGEKTVGSSVIVIGGGMVGCETAEHIWERWRATGAAADVTVVEMLDKMAGNVSVTSRPFFLARLKGKGIRLVARARVVEIEPGGVRVVRTVEETEVTESLPADTVVLATGYTADDAAVAEFTGIVPETYIIGDCANARMIRDAMVEGFATGRTV